MRGLHPGPVAHSHPSPHPQHVARQFKGHSPHPALCDTEYSVARPYRTIELRPMTLVATSPRNQPTTVATGPEGSRLGQGQPAFLFVIPHPARDPAEKAKYTLRTNHMR